MTKSSAQFYARRIKTLEKEKSIIENMLAETCAKLETRPVMTFRQPPPLADCSPEVRDWYGKHRAKKRGKEPAGNECFKS